MYRKIQQQRGVTLLEILLVLIIMSSIILMFIGYMARKGEEVRRDKAVVEAQQILNAALAYYVDHGKWTDCSTTKPCALAAADGVKMIEEGYLPKTDYFSLWGSSNDASTRDGLIGFSDPTNPNNKNFSICIPIGPSDNAATTAEMIAGRLPLGRVSQGSYDTCGSDMPSGCPDKTKPCLAVSTVNIPGQNLNNARSVNFSGVYHNGACVPVPECPTKDMVPQIIVAPVSVSGFYQAGSDQASPLTSFTAYAVNHADYVENDITTGPEGCIDKKPGMCKTEDNVTGTLASLPSGKYWRVCLALDTEQGKVSTINNPGWRPESGTIMVITRCAPPNEPSGSTLGIFSQD